MPLGASVIPTDAPLYAVVAVCGVLQLLLLALLYHAVLGGRREARVRADREWRLLEKALGPPRPIERRRIGYVHERGDGGREKGLTSDESVYWVPEGEDAASVTREVAGVGMSHPTPLFPPRL